MTPAITLPVWDFITAKYTAAADKLSMDMTNTLPAATCPREPLRKDIAKAPDSNPMIPELI
jgi:hypothetical protein